MTLKIFESTKNLSFINKWLQTRNLPESTFEDLPRLGYMVYEEDAPIAAGFLRMVEGGFAQIDSLITNPEKSSDIRDKAIELLINRLIDNAKDLKIKAICSYSIDGNTILRAKRHEFTALPHTVIYLDMTKKKKGN